MGWGKGRKREIGIGKDGRVRDWARERLKGKRLDQNLAENARIGMKRKRLISRMAILIARNGKTGAEKRREAKERSVCIQNWLVLVKFQ